LQHISPTMTYKLLHDRIYALVHDQFELQAPMLQGDGDKVVFGTDRVPAEFAVPVLRVEDERVLLNAGQALGVRKGAKFAIYQAGTLTFSDIAKRIAIAEITDNGATESWAKITEHLKDIPIEQGNQAVLYDPGSAKVKRPVALRQDDVTIEQERALEAVSNVLEARADGFIPLAKKGEAASFQVVVNENSEYEIWDSSGNSLENLRPAQKISDPKAAETVVDRLNHLARFFNARDLFNNSTTSSLAEKLEVTLLGREVDFELGDKPNPQPFQEQGETPTLNIGEWTFIRIKNKLPADSRDPLVNVLNITVLDLQPDWGITQVHPPKTLFVPLDPGKEFIIPLQASLPEGYEQGKDIIKVFATLNTTNFKWLELPALDKPTTRGETRAGKASNLLEQFMEAMVDAAPKQATRTLTPPADPSGEWVVAQVEVIVKKS
jgi:hypothetical protein